jgi:2-methylisocitrate lyase-like PEP mutase family enzyme
VVPAERAAQSGATRPDLGVLEWFEVGERARVERVVRELQELGVARVSTGPFTQRVALTALQDAALAVVSGGTLPEGTRALN